MRLFQVVDRMGRKPCVGMPVISRNVGLSRLGRRGLAYTYWSHVSVRRETIRVLANGLISAATVIPLGGSCVGCGLHAISKSIATKTIFKICSSSGCYAPLSVSPRDEVLWKVGDEACNVLTGATSETPIRSLPTHQGPEKWAHHLSCSDAIGRLINRPTLAASCMPSPTSRHGGAAPQRSLAPLTVTSAGQGSVPAVNRWHSMRPSF
jgi:hypothetical protein